MPGTERLAAYYNAQYQVPADRHAARAPRAAQALQHLLGGQPPARLLEIGCSYGDVLALLAGQGWTVTGIELDDRAAAEARRRGLNVRTGTVDAAVAPGETFDVIYASHVVEHVADPTTFMARVAAALAPQGQLVLRTPNAGSLAARWLSSRWEWAAVPEHVHVYSARSVSQLLQRHGLVVTQLATQRGDAHPLVVELPLAVGRAWRRRGAGGGTAGGSTRAVGAVPPTHRAGFRAVASALGVVQRPLDALLGAAGLGEELVVVARRAANI